MITYQSTFGKSKGGSLLSPAHGSGGARATIKNVSAPPPSEKIRSVQQAGKKKRGSGGNEFLPACSAPKAGRGWEADRPCVSKEAKPAKIDSLIEKKNCARQLVQSEKSSRKVYNYCTVKQKPNLSWVSV